MRATREVFSIVAVMAAVALMWGCSGHVPAPTSFDTFNAKDGTVQCKYPAGWEQNGGGGRKFYSCAFQKGGAEIRILADIAGSAVGDIAGARNRMAGLDSGTSGIDKELAEELAPVAQVHEKMTIPQASEDLGELTVKATETIRTGFGDTRRSEFACSSTFGAERHGYLVTALGLNHRIRVICTCPESNWATLKPAFDDVINSLAKGQPEL
jgi:hypothetical protein